MLEWGYTCPQRYRNAHVGVHMSMTTTVQPDVALFRTMLDRLPTAAYACDADGLIIYFNAKAAQLWGREPKLNHADDRYCGSFRLFSAEGTPIPHAECWMALALQHRREYVRREILIERSNGALATVLAYATPLLDDTGGLLAGINMLVDISDRKRLERLLRDANETKTLYMSTLAEELRHQLGDLDQALAQIEGDTQSASGSREAVERMHATLADMRSLVADLLDVPRSAGAQDPHAGQQAVALAATG